MRESKNFRVKYLTKFAIDLDLDGMWYAVENCWWAKRIIKKMFKRFSAYMLENWDWVIEICNRKLSSLFYACGVELVCVEFGP